MFTGIITHLGTIVPVIPANAWRVKILCDSDLGHVDIGASIACSGACLTVVDYGHDEGGRSWFLADLSAETQRCTAPGMWDAGRRLNLERALRVGDELGGHIVTGHVDGVASCVDFVPGAESVRALFQAPVALAPFIATKGSICLDGISLTVNDVVDKAGQGVHFAVNLIPHTLMCTSWQDMAVGRAVNVEIDLLSRYLARMTQISPHNIV